MDFHSEPCKDSCSFERAVAVCKENRNGRSAVTKQRGSHLEVSGLEIREGMRKVGFGACRVLREAPYPQQMWHPLRL